MLAQTILWTTPKGRHSVTKKNCPTKTAIHIIYTAFINANTECYTCIVDAFIVYLACSTTLLTYPSECWSFKYFSAGVQACHWCFFSNPSIFLFNSFSFTYSKIKSCLFSFHSKWKCLYFQFMIEKQAIKKTTWQQHSAHMLTFQHCIY